MNRAKHLFLLFLLIALLINSCDKKDSPDPEPNPKPDNSIVLSGQVKNNPHDAYVADVDVIAKANSSELGKTKTNSDGYFSLKLEDKTSNFSLNFSHDVHELKDTNLVWKNYNLDPILQVKPTSEDGLFNLNVLSSDSPLSDALVKLYSNPGSDSDGDLLVEGKTGEDGSFSKSVDQTYWIFNNDTISKIKDLKLDVSAENHLDTSMIFDYVKELDVNLALRRAVNNFWLTGEGSPNSAEVQGWLSGNVILDGVVVNNFYETNKYGSDAASVVLDSLIMNKQGFAREKYFDFALSPGGNNLDFVLDELMAQNYRVSLNLFSTNSDKTPLSFRGYALAGNDTLVVKNFDGEWRA